MKIVIVIFLLHSLCSVKAKIPDYIQLCSKTNDLTKCLTDNVQIVMKKLSTTGDSSLKIPPLNNIHLSNISMQAAKELQLFFTDVDCTGMENTQLKDIKMSDKELQISAYIPNLIITGGYELNGKILVLSIEGVGSLNLTYVGITFNYKAKLKTEERKNKKYYYVDNNSDDTQLNISNITRVHFALGNLFGGDPRLGPEMNLFLNDNWVDIYGEIKQALQHTIAFSLMHPVINGFLRHIPIDNLFS